MKTILLVIIGETSKNNKSTTSKSFEYKTKVIGSTPNNNSRLDAEVVVSLKHLSNFWGSLHLLLINWEIELDFSWSRNCIISEISRTPEIAANLAANPPIAHVTASLTIEATFEINKAKFYAPVVTLSINDNIKFAENIKQGFKRTMSWNK